DPDDCKLLVQVRDRDFLCRPKQVRVSRVIGRRRVTRTVAIDFDFGFTFFLLWISSTFSLLAVVVSLRCRFFRHFLSPLCVWKTPCTAYNQAVSACSGEIVTPP